MPYSDRPFVEMKPPSVAPGGNSDGVIQSPDISEEGRPRQHSIRDVSMAREVIRTVMEAGRNRAIVNARIAAKVNAERPYDQSRLEQEGLGWRQNFSTRPLPLLAEKVSSRFPTAVEGLKYFTNSSLSDKWANATEKTETFRKTITDVIRARRGWKTLVDDISFTNSLFGHSIVAWLDEFTWFPRAFPQDESFVSDGTKQLPEYAQVVVLRENFLPHELFKMIKDRDAAKSVGWNLENTIDAINNASPSQIRDMLAGGGTTETWYENARRELSLGVSYMAGASIIAVYSLLAVEANGKVSHYRLAGTELKEIFSKDDRFDSAEDCLAFFSFERGNGTLYGSKGLGRQIYELAGMIDRSRNEIVDRAIMSGKTLIQGDIKRLHTFRMSVIGSTVIIPNGWTVLEQRVDGNIEPFLRLDAYFGLLIDQLVGNVSPPQLGGQGEAFRSPAAWNLLAAREEEGKDARIMRFLEQFVAMVGVMQRRICSKSTIDDDAKAAQKKLLEKMTREELDELAEMPVAGTIQDLTSMQRQMIVALAQEKRGNPLYNQRALEVADLTARMGTEFADTVLLPVEDPTEEAEQTRQQMLEFTLLALGQPVPISPRDNDVIHLKVLLPSTEQLAAQIMQGTSETAGLEASIQHITEHVNSALAKGTPKEELAAAQELVKNAGAALAQLKALDAQAQQLQQESAVDPNAPPVDPNALPVDPNALPPEAAPPLSPV